MPYYSNLYTPYIPAMPNPGGSAFHPSRARRKIGWWAEEARNEVYRVQKNVKKEQDRIQNVYMPRVKETYKNAIDDYYRSLEANQRNYSDEFSAIKSAQKEAEIQQSFVSIANNQGINHDLAYMAKAKVDAKVHSSIDKLEFNNETNKMRLNHQKKIIDDKYEDDLYSLQLKFESGQLYYNQLEKLIGHINCAAQDAKDAISSAHNSFVFGFVGSLALGAITGGLAGGFSGALKGSLASLANLTLPKLLESTVGGSLGKFISGFVTSALGIDNPFLSLTSNNLFTSSGAFSDLILKGNKTTTTSKNNIKAPGIIYDEKSRAKVSDELIHQLGGRVLNPRQLSSKSYDILNNNKQQNSSYDIFSSFISGAKNA